MIIMIQHKDILEFMDGIDDSSMDMIWIEPDYNCGISYNGHRVTKGFYDYIDWLSLICREAHRILKPTGNMFAMNYPKQNAYLRVRILDEVFYNVFENVWIYNSNVGHSPKRLTRAHRTILHCTKTKDNNWYKDAIAMPYQNLNDKRIQGRISNGSKGRSPYSWNYFDLVKNVSKDKRNHPCQIPIDLFNMYMFGSTMPGDNILVCFAGGGNEVVSAVENGRNVWTCDIVEEYITDLKKRLK